MYYLIKYASVAQLAEQGPLKPKVAGSIPAGGTELIFAPLAQSVEQWPFKPTVGGSIPSRGTKYGGRGVIAAQQAVALLARVQIPPVSLRL